jgi:hypothetical protein
MPPLSRAGTSAARKRPTNGALGPAHLPFSAFASGMALMSPIPQPHVLGLRSVFSTPPHSRAAWALSESVRAQRVISVAVSRTIALVGIS